MSESTVTLTGIVRDALDRSSYADPRDIAKWVSTNTPDELIEEFYIQALVHVVRNVMSTNRSKAVPSMVEQAAEMAPPAVRRKSAPSSKVAKIRQWASDWERKCNHERINGVGGVSKLMGECTSDDLRYAADDRRKRSEALMNAAGWYASLAERMDEFGVATLRQLPEAAIADLEGAT